MPEFFTSKGIWFYIASFKQYVGRRQESGVSVIILGIGICWLDNPYNPKRREWVVPRNAWDHIEGE